MRFGSSQVWEYCPQRGWPPRGQSGRSQMPAPAGSRSWPDRLWPHRTTGRQQTEDLATSSADARWASVSTDGCQRIYTGSTRPLISQKSTYPTLCRTLGADPSTTGGRGQARQLPPSRSQLCQLRVPTGLPATSPVRNRRWVDAAPMFCRRRLSGQPRRLGSAQPEGYEGS